MSDPDAGEYDLADLPEPRAPGAPAPQPRPLPRLWKSETDDEEQPATDAPGKETENAATGAKQTRPPEARSRPSAAKSRPRAKGAHAAEGQEKKALVEETPALDTYEARQRGRLVIGGLITACFAIFGWIFYQLFFHDPSPIDGPTDEAHAVSSAPEPSRDLDVEARALLNRAQEHANAGRVKEAVALLETLVKSYRGTNTAAEARKALDRPRQNLPLFLDRPTIQASSAPAPAEPAAPPPPVVTAVPNPTRGNATLTLPANPAEITPSPGPPQDLTMATTATATATATVTAPTPTPTPTAAGGGPGPAMPARVLPRGFRPRASTSLDASGWPLAIVGDRDGAPMVLVPGGTFLMGNDDGPPAESPAHKVRLSTYYIDQHEVTVRQFRVFLGETHYRGQPPRSWSTDLGESVPDTQPMVMVNARDALAYAEWALKHLPTEAQWEMAARSSDGRLYPWGPQPARDRSAAIRRDARPGHDRPERSLALRSLRHGRQRPGVDQGLV